MKRRKTTKKFWKELSAYFSLRRHALHIKRKNQWGTQTQRKQGDLIRLFDMTRTEHKNKEIRGDAVTNIKVIS
jgi:hypothetical protein